MADEKKTEEQLFYLPPPQLSKWEGFKLFLWNSEKKEVMGRTAGSWGKVGLFYLIFYAALAAFFALLLVIFYQTLDNFEPKWQQDRSLIGNNPGLGFRPMPPEENIESTLIWFRHGDNGNWQYWTDALHNFMLPYEDGRQDGEHYTACTFDGEREKGKVCRVNINDFKGRCMKSQEFGYKFGEPCVAIKVNRIFGWVPECFNKSSTPDSLPQELKDEIAKTKDNENYLWITCEGENAADQENIGNVTYWPKQGIPIYYFPFVNTPGYLSPLVMVHFHSVQPGVLVNIECRAWAHNINYNRAERKGSVHLELLVD